MFDYQHLKNEFDEQGFVIISKLFDLERVDHLQKVCDKILFRGNYFADKPRKTLALLYGSSVDWHTPQVNFFWQLLYSTRTK